MVQPTINTSPVIKLVWITPSSCVLLSSLPRLTLLSVITLGQNTKACKGFAPWKEFIEEVTELVTQINTETEGSSCWAKNSNHFETAYQAYTSIWLYVNLKIVWLHSEWRLDFQCEKVAVVGRRCWQQGSIRVTQHISVPALPGLDLQHPKGFDLQTMTGGVHFHSSLKEKWLDSIGFIGLNGACILLAYFFN